MPSVHIVLLYDSFRLLLVSYRGHFQQHLIVCAIVERVDCLDLLPLRPTSICTDNIHTVLQDAEFREDWKRQNTLREAGSYHRHHQCNLQLYLCLLLACREGVRSIIPETEFYLLDSHQFLFVGFCVLWNAETQTKQYTIQDLGSSELLIDEYKFNFHANLTS